MKNYEITLEDIGRTGQWEEMSEEYGLGLNPPIVIQAKSKKEALSKLCLPKDVSVKTILRV